jgi:hypothetical protein
MAAVNERGIVTAEAQFAQPRGQQPDTRITGIQRAGPREDVVRNLVERRRGEAFDDLVVGVPQHGAAGIQPGDDQQSARGDVDGQAREIRAIVAEDARDLPDVAHPDGGSTHAFALRRLVREHVVEHDDAGGSRRRARGS